MRNIPDKLKTAWESGLFIGQNRNVVRATIQKIHIARTHTGEWVWQSALFPQVHKPRELPNCWYLSRDEDTQSPTFDATLKLYNYKPLPIGTPPPEGENRLGRPGFYTPRRGVDPATLDMWSQVSNEWRDWLVYDRVVRTYEGYGWDPNVAPENDPNLSLTGVWLITTLDFNAGDSTGTGDSTDVGTISVGLKNFGRMLTDDFILFPPIVPLKKFPLRFDPYHKVNGIPITDVSAPGWTRPTYTLDSNVPYNGSDGNEHGHRPDDAFDGTQSSYWMSVGNESPDADYSYEFVQGKPQTSLVLGVRGHVWGGPYRCYLSVHTTDKGWLGRATIAYNPGDPISAPNGANVPFVDSLTVDREGYFTFQSPVDGWQNVDQVRVTFHHLYNSGIGPFVYRAGVRNLETCGETMTVEQTYKWVGYNEYCADTETEILTKRGWLTYDRVEAGDETLALDPETGVAEWSVISKVNTFEGERDMIGWESQLHSSLTTRDHRWLTTGQNGQSRWDTTETMPTGRRIPLAAPVVLPTTAKYEDDFVELVAWFWTEGWWNGNAAALAQSVGVNPGHVDRIRAALRSMLGTARPFVHAARFTDSLRWNESERDGMVMFGLSRGVADRLHSVMSQEKVVSPDFLCALTAAQLELFIERSIDADGWRRGSQVALSQGHEGRARAFEMACLLAGRGIRTRKRVINGCDTWVVQVLRHRVVMSEALRRTEVHHEGIVWCPSVEHGNWMARRNGTAYFTGNTDIIKILCAMGGFFWPSTDHKAKLAVTDGDILDVTTPHADAALGGTAHTKGRVWGDFQDTGTGPITSITPDQLDKQPIYSAIQIIQETIGFLFYIDETGGVVWRMPNYFKLGNYVLGAQGSGFTNRDLTAVNGEPAGSYTPITVDSEGRTSSYVTVQDKQTIQGFSATLSGANVRERVFVGNLDGIAGSGSDGAAAVAKGRNPYPSGFLRVAGWLDQHFRNKQECARMAELIALAQYLTLWTDTITIAGNPQIQIDDQIKVEEETTSDLGFHYVQSIHSENDMTKSWTYELRTNLLGTDPDDKSKWIFDPDDFSVTTTTFLKGLKLL